MKSKITNKRSLLFRDRLEMKKYSDKKADGKRALDVSCVIIYNTGLFKVLPRSFQNGRSSEYWNLF
jgi:hypothetical protein